MAVPKFSQTIQTGLTIMNKQEILNSVRDAITASSKKFDEIKKESFLAFFDKEGVPKKMWESLYSELESMYHPKKKKSYDRVEATDDTTHKISESKPLDYYSNNRQNEVKQRTPRKSIFGEISKIAG